MCQHRWREGGDPCSPPSHITPPERGRTVAHNKLLCSSSAAPGSLGSSRRIPATPPPRFLLSFSGVDPYRLFLPPPPIIRITSAHRRREEVERGPAAFHFYSLPEDSHLSHLCRRTASCGWVSAELDASFFPCASSFFHRTHTADSGSRQDVTRGSRKTGNKRLFWAFLLLLRCF